MAKQTCSQYAKILWEATHDIKEADLTPVLQAFVRLLAQNRMLTRAPQIINEYIAYDEAKRGIVPVEIITSRKTTEEVLNKIASAVSNQTKITHTIDEKIIGGFITKTKNKICDASIKTQLTHLQKNLVTN